MEKVLLLMWLCTAVNQPYTCKLINPPQKFFKDEYSCTHFGYTHSVKIIERLGRETVNKYNFFTKFYCQVNPEEET
jgi:hypothetical protein